MAGWLRGGWLRGWLLGVLLMRLMRRMTPAVAGWLATKPKSVEEEH